MKKEQYYYSSQLKYYSKQQITKWGFKFLVIDKNTTELELIKNNHNIIWDERQIEFMINNIGIINDAIQQNVLIIEHHPFYHEQLETLDKLLESNNKVVVLGTQYTKEMYKNIRCYSMASSELWCHHDFVHYMIKKWKETRKHTEEAPFLFLSTTAKNAEREFTINQIRNRLEQYILKVPETTVHDLYQKRNKFIKWMDDTFETNMLGGFGSGTPRFDLYDKTFAEIVVETVYNTPVVHLTEKTWRPIACGVPCILLLNPPNLELMRELGYELYPKILYDRLIDCKDLAHATQILSEFCIKINQDEKLKEDLRRTADYNYKKFWEPKSSWEMGIEAVRAVFGFCPLDEIKEKLKEI